MRRVFCILCLVPFALGFLATAQAEQDEGSYPYHRVEGCAGTKGIVVVEYGTGRPFYPDYVFSDFCLDPDAGRVTFTEEIEGAYLLSDIDGLVTYEYELPNGDRESMHFEGDDDAKIVVWTRHQSKYINGIRGADIAHINGGLVGGTKYSGQIPSGAYDVTATVVTSADSALLRKGSRTPAQVSSGTPNLYTIGSGSLTVDDNGKIVAEVNTISGDGAAGFGDATVIRFEMENDGGLLHGVGSAKIQNGRTVRLKDYDWTVVEFEALDARGRVVSEAGSEIHIVAIGSGFFTTHDNESYPIGLKATLRATRSTD